MAPRHRYLWCRRLLALAIGLLLLAGRVAASGDGQTPSPLACPAGEVTWLTGTAPPGSALLVSFADAVVGGGSAGSDGRWRIPLTVMAQQGIYPVAVMERQSRSLVAAFTCYVDLPVGATPTLAPTARPSAVAAPAAPATTASRPMLAPPTATTPADDTATPTPTKPEAMPSTPATATIAPSATSTPTDSAEAPPAEGSPLLLVAVQPADPDEPGLFEYVLIENASSAPQSLAGWQLVHRETGEAYHLPLLTIDPAGLLVVWSGEGEDDPYTGTLFWPSESGRWQPGQTIELRATDGQLVSSITIPEISTAELLSANLRTIQWT
jgi:hypothetical protein